MPTPGLKLCKLLMVLNIKEFIEILGGTNLHTATIRGQVNKVILITIWMIFEPLAGNTRTAGHQRKLRLNVKFLVDLSILAVLLLENVTCHICACFPGYTAYHHIANWASDRGVILGW